MSSQATSSGRTPTGLSASPNATGIAIGFTQGGTVTVTIGGPDPADRNLLSGNTTSAIVTTSNFNGGSTSTIQGNVIGLDREAAAALPNGGGISIDGAGPTFSLIGGVFSGAGNLISGNTASGIVVNVNSGSVTIRGNAISDNAGLGIDLGALTVPLPNDDGDADAGPNDRQNFPIVSSVQALVPAGASTRVQGVLHSTPSTTYDLDFYENPACSRFPREFLEGKTYIGSGQVTTDSSGAGVFDVTLPVEVETGARISATATDPAGRPRSSRSECPSRPFRPRVLRQEERF